MIGEIIRNFAHAVTLLRPGTPTEVNGRFIPGLLEEIALRVAVVPIYGDIALRLPEGNRAKDTICFYSETQFKSVDDDPGNAQQADRILYKGNVYEVQISHPWDLQGGFFEVFAVRVMGDAEPQSVFFGASEDGENLSAGRLSDPSLFAFAANAVADSFIWFKWPDTLGDPEFSFGAFQGGFIRVADEEIDSTLYRVYRSVNHSLGFTKVTVSRDA